MYSVLVFLGCELLISLLSTEWYHPSGVLASSEIWNWSSKFKFWMSSYLWTPCTDTGLMLIAPRYPHRVILQSPCCHVTCCHVSFWRHPQPATLTALHIAPYQPHLQASAWLRWVGDRCDCTKSLALKNRPHRLHHCKITMRSSKASPLPPCGTSDSSLTTLSSHHSLPSCRSSFVHLEPDKVLSEP